MAVKEVFENEIPSRLKQKPELSKEIGSVIHFNITGDGGGQWTLDCTGDGTVTEGTTGESKMTVTCGAADFEKIVAKQMNAQMAAMSGKLKFKPMDMNLAMKLGKLIG